MLTIGLEKELFVLNGGQPVVILPSMGIPFDECGLLAEARGEPHTNPVDAVFSLRAKVYEIDGMVKLAGWALSDKPFLKIPRNIMVETSRAHSKGITSHQNLYGYQAHRNAVNEQTAGIHISFTNPRVVNCRCGDKGVEACHKYFAMWDFVQVFRALDEAFKAEIKASKRNPGFYELKGDGRVEYRSLPADASLDKIIAVLTDLRKKNLI